MIKKINGIKLNMTDIKEAARDAMNEERGVEAVADVKKLMEQIEQSKKITRNLERELEDYLVEFES